MKGPIVDTYTLSVAALYYTGIGTFFYNKSISIPAGNVDVRAIVVYQSELSQSDMDAVIAALRLQYNIIT